MIGFYAYLLTVALHAILGGIYDFLYAYLGLGTSLSKFLRTRQIESDKTDQIGNFEKYFFSIG